MAKRIKIRGDIIPNDYKWIYDLFEIDATCPADVEKAIAEANGDDLIVEINCPGGDVDAGSEIYTMLKNYGRVDTEIVALAASMGSVIAVAGRVVRMSPTASFMLHNVAMLGSGDHRVFEHSAEILRTWDTTIINAYRLKSGQSEEKIRELMAAGGSHNWGSWLTAQEAKELGFVDEIMFDDQNRLVAVASFGLSLKPEVINKIRNLIPPSRNRRNNSLVQARLNLLKLRSDQID